MTNPRLSISTSPVVLQRGVTLIELMVGIVIGLLAVLVISQTMTFSEAQKRSTTSGADAQVNGTLSLYTLERDLKEAGYGLTAVNSSLGCEIRASYKGAASNFTLAPVVIAAGALGAPDTVRVLGSNKENFSVPALIVKDHPANAANFFVNSGVGIADGDFMLAVPEVPDASNWCSLFQVTDSKAGGGPGLGNNQVLHNSGQSDWNNPGGSTIFPAGGYNTGSYLLNLGTIINRSYSISAGLNLQLSTFASTSGAITTQDLFPNIVQLQAFYGKDTNADGTVDTYDKVTPTTQAGWTQILTVRIGIVARSTQFEREVVTPSNPQWDVGTAMSVSGAVDCGTSQCVSIRIDNLPDWQRYRYKVYETTVPLRNMLWRSS